MRVQLLSSVKKQYIVHKKAHLKMAFKPKTSQLLLRATELWRDSYWARQVAVGSYVTCVKVRWPPGLRDRLRIKCSGFEHWLGTLHCVLRQDTLLSQCLSPPRCINGYHRIYRGVVEIFLVTSCYRNCKSFSLVGLFARMQASLP